MFRYDCIALPTELIFISIFVLDISQMLQHLLSIPCHEEAVSVGILEQVTGVEPVSSTWRAEVLAVIRYLHIICG